MGGTLAVPALVVPWLLSIALVPAVGMLRFLRVPRGCHLVHKVQAKNFVAGLLAQVCHLVLTLILSLG